MKMDDFTKRHSALAEALMPSPTMQKAMEEIARSMAKVPNFNLPALDSHSVRMPVIPRIPTQEETNEYQSASVLMKEMAAEALQWKEQLPESFSPAILAILYGGLQIQVRTLSQVSFHGIKIEGEMNGAPCSLLAHQSTVQLLCYAEEIKADMTRNPIGFIWDNNRVDV